MYMSLVADNKQVTVTWCYRYVVISPFIYALKILLMALLKPLKIKFVTALKHN